MAKEINSRKRLYKIWEHMKYRCYNPKGINYKRYGGRGIEVCEEWKNDFQAFYDWSMAHGYLDNLTIDRIDNDGNYEPSNCRWATYKQQMNNTSRTVKINYHGITRSIKEWAEILDMPYTTLFQRIHHLGWDAERAFKEPITEEEHIPYPYTEEQKAYLDTLDKKTRHIAMERIRGERRRRNAGIKTREEYLNDVKDEMNKKIDMVKQLLEKEPNLSLRQLANKTGYSRSTIQRLKKLI